VTPPEVLDSLCMIPERTHVTRAFPVLDWIATLTTNISNKGEQLIRYYGYYNNVSRGKRKKEKPEDKTEISEIGIQGIKKALVLLHQESL
jgi:hypothetical protein